MPVSDVVVVGGGPAGLYAGRQLARAGFDVTLLEEHQQIGQPVHCTGVLARAAFEEFDLGADSVLNNLNTVRFYAPSGDSIEFSTQTVEAVVIDRAAFDGALAHQAAEAGVRISHDGRVTAVTVEPHGVTIETAGRVVHARACVLACGASYAVQRKLGFGVPRMLLRSAQAELPAERPGDVEVHLGTRLAPGGFAWAVPVWRGDRSFVRVGVMCNRDAARHFTRTLDQIAPRWGVQVPVDCQPRQKVLPLEPLDRTYGDRLLIVGDAAGIVKSTTGGGIYYSLLTASLAARTLARALDRDELIDGALADYENAWQHHLGAELRSQLMLRRIAQRLTDSDIDGLFELARTDGIMPLMRRTAAFNHHREFIVALLKHPPARRLLFKTALG